MERLKKLYSHFLGEMLHLRNNFPHFLFPVHQLNISILHFYPDSGITIRTNRKNFFLLVFFCIH